MAESVENLRMIRRRNLQDMRRAYCSWKAGAADWFVHKFESNKDCGELPDLVVDQPAKKTRWFRMWSSHGSKQSA